MIFFGFCWILLSFGGFGVILGGSGGVLEAVGAFWGSEICFQGAFLRKENGRGRQKRSQDAPRGVKRRPKGPPKLPE